MSEWNYHCAHKSHRVPTWPGNFARLILPECAGQEAWLAARQGGIGGSEIGALVGVSEYETPFHVWKTKVQGGKDLSHLAHIRWGHRLEDPVASATAEEIGLTARLAGGLWADPERPHLRVTPDRFACRRRSWRAVGVIECKTAGDDDGWANGSITAGGQGDGAAPLGYQAQLQWQLGILGLYHGWLGCLILNPARDFYVVEAEFNAEWFGELVHEADRFWAENVLMEEPPMHNYRHPRTEELAKELHPTVVRESVDLPDDAQEWLDDYRDAKTEYQKAETRFKAAQNYFRLQVGDAAAGYIGDRKVVSYPQVTTNRIDVELLRERYPEVAAEMTTRSIHRRLTINAR